MEAALEKAKAELSAATHLEECGGNAGIRKMNANKAEWLSWIVYLAERGLEAEKENQKAFSEEFDNNDDISICANCPVAAETQRLVKIKDTLINDLSSTKKELIERLEALQLSYDCEVEYHNALANRAKLDWCAKVLKMAHDKCWLDGTVLVTPVECIDSCLLELIEE
jgi:hypothetical protein